MKQINLLLICGVLSLGIFVHTSQPPVQSVEGEASRVVKKTVPTLKEQAAAEIARQLHDGEMNFDFQAGTPDFGFQSSLESKTKVAMNYFADHGSKQAIADAYYRLYPEEFKTQLVQSLNTGERAYVKKVIFSFDSNLIVSTIDKMVYIWSRKDDDTFELDQILDADQVLGDPVISWISYSVESIALSHDGMLLATGTSNGFLKIWSRQGGNQFRLLQSLDVGSSGLQSNYFEGEERRPVFKIHSIAFSPDDKTIALGLSQRKVLLCSKNNNVFEFAQKFDHKNPLNLVDATDEMYAAFSADGSTLVMGASGYGGLSIYFKNQDEQDWRLSRQPIQDDRGYGEIASLMFDPNNDYFVYASAADVKINICVRQADNSFANVQRMKGLLASVSSNGLLAISSYPYELIDIWVRNNNQPLKKQSTLKIQRPSVFSPAGSYMPIALSLDGNYLAAATDKRYLGEDMGIIQIWKIGSEIVSPTTEKIWKRMVTEYHEQISIQERLKEIVEKKRAIKQDVALTRQVKRVRLNELRQEEAKLKERCNNKSFCTIQ